MARGRRSTSRFVRSRRVMRPTHPSTVGAVGAKLTGRRAVGVVPAGRLVEGVMRSLRLVGLMIVGACDGGGSRVDDILALSGDEAAGDALYAQNCAVCHGASGGGGSGPNLTGESLDGEVVQVILSGEDEMQAFGDVLSDQEIADILAWLDVNVFE